MLRSLWTLAVFAVATAVLGIAAALISMIHPGSHMTMRLGKVWSRMILWAAGIRPTYDGLEHVDRTRPRVYISNHQSVFDVWVMAGALPSATLWAAKKSLFRSPFIGWAIRAAGFVSIDRSNRARAIRSLNQAAEKVRSGRPIILFAEGTRSRDGQLGAFKKGPFHLALSAGVPVVPVAVSGTWRILPPGGLRLRPGRVRVSFAPPLDLAALPVKDVDGLIAAVRQAIVDRLDPAEVESPAVVATAGGR